MPVARNLLQISGKDLGALALRGFCPRCFWIRRRADLPWQVFPGIFSSIDSYSKKVVHAHFDTRGAPAWLAPLGTLKTYRSPPSAHRFRVSIEQYGVLLTGAPDAIFERADGTLVIADYKTSRYTPNQDRLLPQYRVQLNAYAWIAARLGWPRISGLALIYTEPVTDDHVADSDAARRDRGFAMEFFAKVVAVEQDEAMLPPLLAKAAEIYALDAPPEGRAGCRDCEKFDAIRALLE